MKLGPRPHFGTHWLGLSEFPYSFSALRKTLTNKHRACLRKAAEPQTKGRGMDSRRFLGTPDEQVEQSKLMGHRQRCQSIAFHFKSDDSGANSLYQAEKVETKEDSMPREPEICHLTDMLAQVNNFLVARPFEKALIRQEEAEDPACIPIFWISKWVDYCDKYGLERRHTQGNLGRTQSSSARLAVSERVCLPSWLRRGEERSGGSECDKHGW
ncbi:hypothetical protein CRUP_034394 [Coryphaenoides rupestris]|nr:hypothetical protein CRUP_034394 [Coryphaenoides rupestris]